MIRGAAAAVALDRYLGDSTSPDTVMSHAETIRLDEISEFPQRAVEALDEWGLYRSYVPTPLGGEFDDVLPAMLQIRQVARRDLTVAVAHGKTFLGSITSWIAGGESATRMSSIVLAGAPVSWGLTEQGRGSDLLRTAARTVGEGDLRLSGGKWPINNATRGRAMCVLVRTREDVAGPRALSLVLADKAEIDTVNISYRPKLRTHGVKGADISGIDWNDVSIPHDRIVGESGQGLELVLKALQLTRPTCTALSLGAADQAVAGVLAFLRFRKVRGSAIAGWPQARAQAGSIVADALIAEATAITGASQAVELTEEMALVSALVKYVVPATVDGLFRAATKFLGARSQLAELLEVGTFEKASRDNRVVGIFDGNSIVNLQVVINEFAAISKGSHREIDIAALLEALDAGTPSNRLELGRLRLITRQGSSLLSAILDLAGLAEVSASPALANAIDTFVEAARTVLAAVATSPRTTMPGVLQFELARQVAYLFAGASCLLVAATNSAATDVARGEIWLLAALDRVCAHLGRRVPNSNEAYADLLTLALEFSSNGRPVTLFDGWAA